MNRKIRSIFMTVTILVFSLTGMTSLAADSQDGTISGTPDAYVEIVMPDNAISFGALDIAAQITANSRTAADTKYVIFESQHDLTPPDNIEINEGASNCNLFVKSTIAGETFLGINNVSWLFLKGTADSAYVMPQISGTLTSGGGGVTLPVGVAEIGSSATSYVTYTSADAGVTWTRNTGTLYMALGDDANLYVGTGADLSGVTTIYTAKGQALSSLLGSSYVLSSTFPAAVGATVTLNFGYAIAWDATQNNAVKDIYCLIDMPAHAASGHSWTWTLTTTGEFVSNPS